ncbi:DUF6541 family protein [Pseudonocardia sp. ICBG1034]|uniref:DUF6541 family protein n=1 Tax=Pseudonocardia sp. ICBG1034 TaxID=2844381 RepID=UPI001CCEFA42|nr:DUF6541 family protein [Pseudonocardia sp. ICBG1034]
MSWLSAGPLLALATAWVVLPGLAISLSAGLRGLTALGFAPVLSVGVIAGSAVAAGSWGVPWSRAVPIEATLWLVGVVVAARLLYRPLAAWSVVSDPASWMRALRRPWTRGDRDGYWVAGAAVLGMTLAGLLGLRTVAAGMGSPDALSQTFDANFHYNAVGRILDRANGSALDLSGLVNASSPYPAAWHDLVSLLVPHAGPSAAIVIASNIAAAVVSVVVWPLSCLVLVRTVAGRSAALTLVTPVLSVGFLAFPWTLITYGALWPNLIGVALLPAALAAVVRAARPGGPPDIPTDSVGRLFLPLVAVAALALAHPNAVFGLVVLSLPAVLWGVVGSLRRAGSAGTWQVVRVAAIGGTSLVGIGAALHTMVLSPQFDSMRSYYWEPERTVREAAVDVLVQSSGGSEPAWALALLVTAGVVASLLRARTSWLVPAYLVVAGLSVVSVTTWSSVWTGVWYNDAPRVEAMVPVIAVPLAAIGLRALALPAAVALRTTAGSLRIEGSRRIAVTAIVAVVVGGVVATTGGMYRATHADQLAAFYQHPEDVLLRPSVERLLLETGDLVPPDAVVAQNPWAGTSMLRPLTGRRVLFPHLHGEWNPAQELIAQRLRDVANDPAVCGSLAASGVGYVISATPTYKISDPRSSAYPGLDDLDAVPGFELLAREGDAELFRITACLPDHVVDS